MLKPLPIDKAFDILAECTGQTIWPLDYARQRGLPPDWIEALSDIFESGFDHDNQTIYYDDQVVGQFRGIRDIDLAIQIARGLGIDTDALKGRSLSRSHLMQLINESIEEG